LISDKQAIKDLNFARADFSVYVKFWKNIISIVVLRRSGIHNLIEVITGRFLGDQDL